jgi:hypothetical protein
MAVDLNDARALANAAAPTSWMIDSRGTSESSQMRFGMITVWLILGLGFVAGSFCIGAALGYLPAF